ncbi:hypothetical protein ABZX40_08915 [Streptomyces sp. NPDC004610]|uniref:hypothetical protein n=1 Tax=unclassified Streptomyces TaxID=2593676 RepID=UPI0033AD6897
MGVWRAIVALGACRAGGCPGGWYANGRLGARSAIAALEKARRAAARLKDRYTNRRLEARSAIAALEKARRAAARLKDRYTNGRVGLRSATVTVEARRATTHLGARSGTVILEAGSSALVRPRA